MTLAAHIRWSWADDWGPLSSCFQLPSKRQVVVSHWIPHIAPLSKRRSHLCSMQKANPYILYTVLWQDSRSLNVSLHITRRQNNWMGWVRIRVIKLKNRKLSVQHSYASAPDRSFVGRQNLVHLLPFKKKKSVGYTLVCVISRYNNTNPE